MFIDKSPNSLGYLEENGVQNSCFTISNEKLSQQQNKRKGNEFIEIQNSCENCNIVTNRKSNIALNCNTDDFLQNKENSNKLKRNIAKNNEYYVSIIDEQGNVQITEAEQARKFSVSSPSKKDKKQTIVTSNLKHADNAEKSSTKNWPVKKYLQRNKIFGCSDEILNSRSSRVNICEIGEETLSNTSEFEANDSEDENANRTSSYCHEIENDKTGITKVKLSFIRY